MPPPSRALHLRCYLHGFCRLGLCHPVVAGLTGPTLCPTPGGVQCPLEGRRLCALPGGGGEAGRGQVLAPPPWAGLWPKALPSLSLSALPRPRGTLRSSRTGFVGVSLGLAWEVPRSAPGLPVPHSTMCTLGRCGFSSWSTRLDGCCQSPPHQGQTAQAAPNTSGSPRLPAAAVPTPRSSPASPGDPGRQPDTDPPQGRPLEGPAPQQVLPLDQEQSQGWGCSRPSPALCPPLQWKPRLLQG